MKSLWKKERSDPDLVPDNRKKESKKSRAVEPGSDIAQTRFEND
jgi:hypothetical protein